MTTYVQSLEQAVRTWIAEHPTEYRELREQVAAEWRGSGKAVPEKGQYRFLLTVFNAEVVESIRKRMGFPSERSVETGHPPAPTPSPYRPETPVAEQRDFRTAASGEK